MRFQAAAVNGLLAGLIGLVALAPSRQGSARVHAFHPALMRPAKRTACLLAPTDPTTEDCGCEEPSLTQDTLYSGKPSNVARSLNHRQAVQGQTVLNALGDEFQMEDLLQTMPSTNNPTTKSIVVFLRSLG